LAGLGGLLLVIFFILRGSQEKVHFRQSKALFILAWVASAVILAIGSLFFFPLFLLVAIEALVAIIGALLIRAPKLSVFTVTLLANLLTIPATLMLNFISAYGPLYFSLFWFIIWIFESLFLGLNAT
jgi:hypothetical protein